jgi:phage shock protein C
MQFIRNSIFTRSDTILGVCQGLGEDLGISPNWFRVALAAVVIVNLEAAIVVYAGLAALVLVSRLAFPNRSEAVTETAPAVTETVEAPVAEAAPKRVPVLAEAA